MSKTLIIAEKPSVAADIARALGGFTRKGDYFESDDHVLSSAVGHLLALSLPEEYDVKKGKWSFARLPVIPPNFELAPIERSQDRLNLLLRLMKRKDVAALVNACDAGREGELIFRYLVNYARIKKPIERLWLQSMTPQAIRDGFDALRPDKELLPLADAARCRSEADWLVGINGTRAMTAFNSKEGGFYLTTVGRVQTPTLAVLVEREERIRAFNPRDFWEVHARFAALAGEYAGRWFDPAFKKDEDSERKAERLWNVKDAEAVVAACRQKNGTVTEESKPSTQLSPLLFDLTSLQREANGRFGFPAKMTLSLAQALYERHKALTYPRTDARALPEDYVATVKKTMEVLGATKEYGALAKSVLKQGWVKSNRRVFDNGKISDHFAIIPTQQAPKQLNEAEQKLYDMVVRRFLAVFHPAAEYLQTTRITKVGEHQFRTEGRVLRNPGWLVVYGRAAQSDSDNLPLVAADELVRVAEVDAQANQTKPPPRYTEATLLSAMEGAGKLVEDDELRAAMEAKGLGTPATRAAIIEGLIQEEYVHRSGQRAGADAEGVFASVRPAPLRRKRDHVARADRRLGIQAEADGSRQASPPGIHGAYRAGHARHGGADQERRHSRYRLRYRCRAVSKVRRDGAGELSKIPVPEVRFRPLESDFGPRVVAGGNRRADRKALHRPSDGVSQQDRQALRGRRQAERRLPHRVRLRPGNDFVRRGRSARLLGPAKSGSVPKVRRAGL